MNADLSTLSPNVGHQQYCNNSVGRAVLPCKYQHCIARPAQTVGTRAVPPHHVSSLWLTDCSTWGWHRKQSLQTPVVSSTHLAGPIRPTVGRQGSAERRYSGTSRSCVMECRSFPAPLRLKWLTVLVSPSLSHCVLGINGFLLVDVSERERQSLESLLWITENIIILGTGDTQDWMRTSGLHIMLVFCVVLFLSCVWCCLFMFCFFVTFVF